MTRDCGHDQQEVKVQHSKAREDAGHEAAQRPAGHEAAQSTLAGLQQLVGNRAVQRLLAQRSGDGAFELDDETAGRINRERAGGQPLDGAVQREAGQTMGQDLSGVRVHTSPEADDLSRQLGAKAFATGRDLFFREGAYNPGSSAGRELIGHELTHVVQQATGAVGGTGKMTVTAPGDFFEREADATAQTFVQRQEEEEEEEAQV